MFPYSECPISRGASFLCLRRGVSFPKKFLFSPRCFSLPTQRCFRELRPYWTGNDLFSAYAEVFLTSTIGRMKSRPFLCLRRGVSSRQPLDIVVNNFSLPTQRCFSCSPERPSWDKLFSAYAEVFLSSGISFFMLYPFLCLRRGVSRQQYPEHGAGPFSLPTQRCFCNCYLHLYSNGLFSAYAEVFLRLRPRPAVLFPFLCLRRGVSFTAAFAASISPFSLPTQRCFWRHRSAQKERSTFLCLRRGVSR